MKNKVTPLLIAALVAGTLFTFPALLRADDKAAPSGAEQKATPPARIPFNGKIHAIDHEALTITLDGKERKRTIHLTKETRILKAGKPAKLVDALVGEEIGGQIIKTAEGKEEAVSLRLGPKPEPEPKEKPQKEANAKQQ